MRHRRDYADVADAKKGQSRPSSVGFLGVPQIGTGLGPVTILAALALAGVFLGFGFKGISWPLG